MMSRPDFLLTRSSAEVRPDGWVLPNRKEEGLRAFSESVCGSWFAQRMKRAVSYRHGA